MTTPSRGFLPEARRAANGLLLRVSAIAAIGGLLFGYLYTGIAVVALLFFVRKVPETKGRSLEQIQDQLLGDQGPNTTPEEGRHASPA